MNFTGTIPTNTNNMTELQHWDISKNKLTGNLPSTLLSSFPELKSFQFHSNFLNGTLSTEIGILTQLQLLEGEYNNFTGTIPSEIGQLTKLQVLQLNHNQLYGNFPNEYLCNKNNNITYILIDCNKGKKKKNDAAVTVDDCNCCHCL